MNLSERLKLYVILDTSYGNVINYASDVIEGGATAIQLRMKQGGKKEIMYNAKKLREDASDYGVLFIVDDYPDIAYKSGANGVHLGSGDADVRRVKERYPELIVGATVHGVEDAKIAIEKGADYLGAGSIYPTRSKKNARVIGIDGLKEIVSVSSVPVVAIGGITPQHVCEILMAGACGVAVISYVLASENPREQVLKLKNSLENC